MPTEYKLHTDGVGCSVYDSHTGTAKLHKLERFSSAHTAQTVAIVFCLHYIETLNTTKFLLYSDSRSVLQKLRQPGRTVTLPTHRIPEKLETIKETGQTVSLIWVKGHSECEGNTMADKYAKQAITEGEEISTTTISDLKIRSKPKMTKRNCSGKTAKREEESTILWSNHYFKVGPGWLRWKEPETNISP